MKRKNLKKPMISALEQRILFDGAAVATAVDVLDNSSFTPTNDSTTTNDMTNNNAENSVHEAQAVQGFEKTRREVAFVDVTVSDYQTLVDGVGEGVETYLVSSLDEIKSILENETNIDAIHILSHGETGEITVGNDVLNKDTLQNFDAVLQSMKSSLTEDGDILLYGCNVASDGSGEEFITELAIITEADVAASDDLTGSSALGGDWDLEVKSGSIEAASLEVLDYDSIFMANQVFNWSTSIYIRPNATSYIWTWGTGDATDSNGNWFKGQITSVSMFNVPDFSWYLDRGHFEYSTNGGSSWTTYNVTDTSYNSYVNTANTLWRFIDTQTTITNDKIGFSYTVQDGSGAVGTSGINLYVDSAPTDITSSNTTGLLVSDTPIGSEVTTLTPVDTGMTTLGRWVIDSQSNPGLFALQSDNTTGNTAKLVINSSLSSLVDGDQVSVIVHYYDAYQTDSSGNPISGEGVTKTLTFTVKGASNDLDFTDDISVNSLSGDTADQYQPSITTLSNGNFIVTWADTTNGGVYSQIYDNAGVPQSTRITIDNSSSATQPTVESLANGKFVVVYTDSSSYDILYKIIDSSNNSVISSGTIESYSDDGNGTQTGGWDSYSSIGVSSSLDGTSFNVTWNLSDWATVKSSSYSDSGIQSGSTMTMNTSGYYPESTILSNGDIVNISGDGNSWEGFNILINNIQVGTTIGDTYDPVGITTLSEGGFVVTWSSKDYSKIYAQIFDNTGSSTSSIFEVNTNGSSVSLPKVSALSDGSFTIVWVASDLDGSGNSIQGRRFDSTGTAIDTNDFQVNEYRFGNQEFPVITSLANGAFAVAWVDSASGKTTGSDIEARVLLVSPGPTVSEATGSYTDTVANDTFTNTTGTISATASSGSITGYGINGGTTSGSNVIGGITYDVSKAGTYGTLYVVSIGADKGKYVYVPTNDSVINATSSTVTDVFTIEATDSAGTKGNTLTITINGVNDTPIISNEITNQTAIQNSIFNFQIPSNSFTDVDTSDTLTYTVELVDSNGNLINGGILPTWLTFNTGTQTFSGTPTNSDVGTIYIKVTATDNGIGNLNVSDVFSIKVENINDNPIGNVIISGLYIQGEILTVSNTLTDEDGLGEVTYQWYANNEIIDGATNSTYKLTQNEVNKVITVKATYIDGFGTQENVISNVTNPIININDAPTVLVDNIDINLSFGDSYTKNISELFKDIDFDNIFEFKATNLPLGLTIDSSTGVISGKANESGEFIVTIKATDNGNPALSVSRTYKIFVLAPVQIENPQPPVSEPLNNTPSNVISNITLSTFSDIISLGTINNNLGTNSADNVGIGYLNNTPPTSPINDYNPSQNIPIIRENSKYIEANAKLNINLNGQVSFDKTIQDSFSIVGITIEDLKIDNNKLEIRIVDTANAQSYIVTQFDGSALPTGLRFDLRTGSISGTIPDNLTELNITIKAINSDGTTRILNLKLDLKQLKQRSQVEIIDNQFLGLKEQLAFENQKLNSYGSYLTKLFA